MTRKRKTAADQVVALARGGLDAIRVAEELVRNDDWLQVRVSKTRKGLYSAAAKAAGLSLSAWVLRQLDNSL